MRTATIGQKEHKAAMARIARMRSEFVAVRFWLGGGSLDDIRRRYNVTRREVEQCLRGYMNKATT